LRHCATRLKRKEKKRYKLGKISRRKKEGADEEEHKRE
jgi:hypothetical protein